MSDLSIVTLQLAPIVLFVKSLIFVSSNAHAHTFILVCRELSVSPASGTIEYSNNRTIGSTATYLNFQCNVGFERRGALVRRCSENGWEGSTPYCSELVVIIIAYNYQ